MNSLAMRSTVSVNWRPFIPPTYGPWFRAKMYTRAERGVRAEQQDFLSGV